MKKFKRIYKLFFRRLRVNFRLMNTVLAVYSLSIMYVFGLSDLTFFFLFFSLIGFVAVHERVVAERIRARIAAQRREFVMASRRRAAWALFNAREEARERLKTRVSELSRLSGKGKGLNSTSSEVCVEQRSIVEGTNVVDNTTKLTNSASKVWEKSQTAADK